MDLMDSVSSPFEFNALSFIYKGTDGCLGGQKSTCWRGGGAWRKVGGEYGRMAENQEGKESTSNRKWRVAPLLRVSRE